MHAGVSLLDAADDEDGAASDGAAQAPAREYVPPPAKLDDPEENYKILTSWRGNIHAAQECFRKLDMEGAERELKTALEKAAHFGSGSAPVATSLVNLAELYRRLGRFKEALPLLERATDTLDQTAGPNNKVTIRALVDLADTHLQLKSIAAASDGFEDVLRRLDIAEENQVAGRDPLRLVRAGVLLKAAALDVELGMHAEAEAKLRQSLAIAEERWGKDSPRTLAPVAELARLLQSVGRVQEADAMCSAAERMADKEEQKQQLAKTRRLIDADLAAGK